MKTILFALLLPLLLLSKTPPDNCISCHTDTSPIDNFHSYSDMGCASCHGGDPKATQKDIAHRGIVLTPSRLDSADRFCSKCHKEIVDRVKLSIMNDMHGVLDVLKYQFGETKSIETTTGIEYLKTKPSAHQSIAESHFSKLCAACHIDQDEKIFTHHTPRGGGCVDCHRVESAHWIDRNSSKPKLHHPKLSTRIPSANCLKCHNRSNRIGLSYFGKFESEGYGTPYRDGNLTHQIDRGRYYYELPADIHHTSAKLECIDCHTEKGVMGDGKRHAHMEDSVDISCVDCHDANMSSSSEYGLAGMLSALNGKVPYPQDIAISKRKGSPLYNIQKKGKQVVQYRKMDGQEIAVSQMSKEPYHTLALHQRLECSACHSAWIPSCYGCHEIYFQGGKQYDWIKHKKTDGQWMEKRSYLRYESPALAIGYNQKIMPTAPGCQVIMSIYDKKGDITKDRFHAMAYAAWDPHTTQKQVRSCKDCHINPQTLGIGAGTLYIDKNSTSFIPYWDASRDGMDMEYPIDALVSVDGEQFQTFSRESARGFNQKEIGKIVGAYRCILCHDSYSDKIYRDYNLSKNRFKKRQTPCSRY